MDINAPDFAENFDKTKAVIGIIGQGFVGSAMKSYFSTYNMTTVTYDKFKPETGKSLEDVVRLSDIIFICVPTPMRQTGECYTGIPEEVFEDVHRTAREVGRPTNSFVVCLKSTVPPGFTESMRKKYPDMRITFSPEFLTEKNSHNDMIEANRIIVGGDNDDTSIVLQYFFVANPQRVKEGKTFLVQCPSATAEMAKLFINGLLFTKVLFANEVFALCHKMGISYNDVKILSTMDPRIGVSHLDVPGHDGHMGAGGHCFPKDMHNLKFLAEKFEVPEKMFSVVLERNGEVRKEKDWEKMNDRAVTEK